MITHDVYNYMMYLKLIVDSNVLLIHLPLKKKQKTKNSIVIIRGEEGFEVLNHDFS